ncbi:hypothetical protein ACQP3L_33420, partial [Escherichia coli]
FLNAYPTSGLITCIIICHFWQERRGVEAVSMLFYLPGDSNSSAMSDTWKALTPHIRVVRCWVKRGGREDKAISQKNTWQSIKETEQQCT